MNATTERAAPAGELRRSVNGTDDALPARRDGYLVPMTSLRSRVARLAWSVAYCLLFWPSPRPAHGWRALILRSFGARLGPSCHIYPRARIWAPWNLVCEDAVAIADGAEIYNAATVTLRSHCIVSQQAYVCGATHDYNDPDFPMISDTIEIGRYAWIGALA